MAGNHHHPDEERHDIRLPDMSRPGLSHEKSDVDVSALLRFGIGLAALAVVSFVLIWVFYRVLEGAHGGPVPPTGLNITATALPPEPRLQETPISDLKQMLDAQDKLLHTYGWVDRQHGIVRVPIDRAIDMLAQRGLPSRATPGPASAAASVTIPDESGLGPIMIQPGGPLHSQLENHAAQAAGGSH
ncbi:MAG TPA: hypothetical protein VMA31_03750 [Bryobacteraceae bacterium]|nr:hypothetical protein [Bryobacteraceae bacterium]